MRIVFAAALSLVIVTPVLGQPAPAGQCKLSEGLVLQATPPPEPANREDDPHILSMALPHMGSGSVADIAFRIEADGRVTTPKILCVSDKSSDIEAALIKASQSWRFEPMKRMGYAVAADAAYRISASGAVPLSFSPRRELRKIEG